MNSITTKDGSEIFYKDWGSGQAIVFHHGWPLTADDWDAQMMYFVLRGYRVIAHDRRGHGRSTRTATGNDMDTYAADVAEIGCPSGSAERDSRRTFHRRRGSGPLRGAPRPRAGGEGRTHWRGASHHGQTARNPAGLPIEVFDGFRTALAGNRAQFFRDVPAGPFYGFNRPGAKVYPGVIDNWWRQGMMGGAKAHYDCIKAFSETDFTEDLQDLNVPVLIMHGDDDQSCRSLTLR
jgi:non-heme chloroperoxidase